MLPVVNLDAYLGRSIRQNPYGINLKRNKVRDQKQISFLCRILELLVNLMEILKQNILKISVLCLIDNKTLRCSQ